MWELYGSGMEQVAEAVAAELGLPLHAQAFSSDEVEEQVNAREKEGTLGRWLRSHALRTGSGGGDDRAGRPRPRVGLIGRRPDQKVRAASSASAATTRPTFSP